MVKKKHSSVQKVKNAKKRTVKTRKAVKRNKVTKKAKIKQNPLHRVNGQEVIIKIEY